MSTSMRAQKTAWTSRLADHCRAGFAQESYNRQDDLACSATLLHSPAGHRPIDARISHTAAAWDESVDEIHVHIYKYIYRHLHIYIYIVYR